MSLKSNKEKLEYIEGIKKQNKILENKIPSEIKEIDISKKSRIPFKIKSLEFILAKRIYEISNSAIKIYEKSPLSFLILTRSISESSAILFWLMQKINTSIENKNVEIIDKFVLRIMFGSKAIDTEQKPYNPYNVLDAIDKVEKKFKGFRKNYDMLCDYTHPNYSGAFSAFGNLESETGTLKIVNSSTKINLGLETHMLVVSLANQTMDQIEKKFSSFVSLCELTN